VQSNERPVPTSKRAREVVVLYDDGVPPVEIARQLGVTSMAIYRHLERWRPEYKYIRAPRSRQDAEVPPGAIPSGWVVIAPNTHTGKASTAKYDPRFGAIILNQVAINHLGRPERVLVLENPAGPLAFALIPAAVGDRAGRKISSGGKVTCVQLRGTLRLAETAGITALDVDASTPKMLVCRRKP
jgi:hypothetical protein